ncbi:MULTISPECIES: hypothetical protein [Burkholderia]|nr:MULTISPECIES: hypothetical protein [Burkholderia]
MTAVTATIGAFVGTCDVVTYNANPGGRPGKEGRRAVVRAADACIA